MATTVGQHPVSAFTSPKNGDPLDANVVVSNDNTVRVAYVDHDADPGIHVQSSVLSSRPAAGTAGRKWINSDYPQKLWYDDGTDWHEIGGDSINVYCKATETIAKGDVVKVTGWNNGQNVAEIAKVASSSDVAFGVAESAIANGSLGYVINTGILLDVNTAAFSIGNVLYPNTSGGFTSTKPTSGTYQPCAYVLRANASNGALYIEFSAPRIVESSSNTASTVVLRDASGNFTAGTITATLSGAAPAGSLSGSTLASNVTASSLTSVGTLSSLAVGTGGFAVNTNSLYVNSSTGNVGVGTTTPADAFTVHGNPMRVGQSSTAEYLQLGATSLGGWIEQYGGVDLSVTNIGNKAIIFSTNSIARGRFENTGNFIPSADNSYSLGKSGARWSSVWSANGTIQTSDETAKADITDSDLGLAFVTALRPVSYRWKVRLNEVVRNADGQLETIAHPGMRRHYGLLAQQVKSVLGDKDFGGYICDADTGEQGLRYEQFVPVLIKAIQEQQAMITALQAEVASLRAS